MFYKKFNQFKKIKIIILFIAIFIFFLFLTKHESLNSQQKNNKIIKQEKTKIIENKDIVVSLQNNIATPQHNKKEIQKELNNNQKLDYYKVIKIIDGDTVIVDINGVNETIRLIGINTPETKDPRKLVECFGIEASNKAEELLNNKLVFLEKDVTQKEKDKYNRLLRYIKTKDGLFYNLEIIKQGYAYEYTYIIPYKYQSEFKEAENYARINKLGLWADNSCKAKNIDSATTTKSSKIKTQCECLFNKYNCADFKTHADAQLLFDCCGGVKNDIHKLDGNKDGIVCKSLP
ncbi:MAG: thermonuclease family protein [Patescibacteria group bacterium]